MEVDKDYELLYIYTDLSDLYMQDSKNIYSKPLKCPYDLYTATWRWGIDLTYRHSRKAFNRVGIT